MADCGCNTGGHAGWNQGWRTPLRQALDWLRDQLVPLFEGRAKELLRDPWQARDDYISVILDRSGAGREAFLAAQAARELSEQDKVGVMKLMELQRHAMLMYTSCGWFFDEVSGIESVQVVQYAARALQLARELFEKDLEDGFLNIFQGARSNLPENGDGRTIFQKFVRPAMLDWPRVTAHYAISSVFHSYGEKTRIFAYSFEDEHRQLLTSGKTRLGIGRTRVFSEITGESQVLSYSILYLGEHNLTGGVRTFQNAEEFERMLNEVRGAYERADFPETIRLIDRHFGQASYSLNSLFKDEQRRILDEILISTREDLESRFRLIAERYTPLMKFLETAGAPLPSGLDTVTDFVLHSDIRRQIEAEATDLERLRSLIQEGHLRQNRVFDANISFAVKNKMESQMRNLVKNAADIDSIRALRQLAELVMPLPLGLNLWKVQNTYWELLQKSFADFRERAVGGSEPAREWVLEFLALGERLGFAVKGLQESVKEMKLAA